MVTVISTLTPSQEVGRCEVVRRKLRLVFGMMVSTLAMKRGKELRTEELFLLQQHVRDCVTTRHVRASVLGSSYDVQPDLLTS